MDLRRFFVVLAIVATYWVISIGLVIANSKLLGPKKSEDISVFCAWAQSALGSLSTCIVILLRGDFNTKDFSNKYVVLQSFSHILMLTLNNFCLKLVGVVFYQIARSLTLLFVVSLSAIILKKSISCSALTCCIALSTGFALGVDQERAAGSLNLSGVIYGIVTSLVVALNGVLTSKAMHALDGNAVKLAFVLNTNAAILLFPLVLFTGQWQVERLFDNFNVMLLVLTGLMAAAMSWISALQIAYTSPITHHVSASAKSVVQTFIGSRIEKESRPILWWLSVLIVASASVCYALVRTRELRTVEKKQPISQNNNEKHAKA
ncbi:unnamed protein product [Dimorphilus gyrociliatus]|uniref:Sugar phosphate transporter domain-containing protein n=1 Tax=Dimorphilus gyrociliatus TaxID=2664684 RepID=A0A7I8W0T5_9ANNE|nr:unnamed protein product [Dimorphilus gyrociliatus]